MKTTFTAKELDDKINDILTVVSAISEDNEEFWREETFPLEFKTVGNDTDVTLSVKEFFGGEEDGDHSMRCILQVGEGDDVRYFLKTGVYNSWDDSEWDGPLMEVYPETMEVIKWVTRGNEYPR